jgi:hypothetical protein
MDKNSIIKSVKRQEEEKVAFSLKIPASVKEQLQIISDNESVSMNSLIVATLQSFIDDECGSELRHAKSLLNNVKPFLANNLEDDYERATDPEEFEVLGKKSALLNSITTLLTKE